MKFWNTQKETHDKKIRVHLDYASTTPVRTEVLSLMQPYFNEVWANANAIYREGVRAREVVDDARAKLARQFHVRPTDVVFTSGGTESNNLALIGHIEALHKEGIVYTDMEIITTRIEHPSITETVKHLESRGVVATYVDVHEDGRIVFEHLQSLFSPRTRLVTFAYVNSEIGVVQDVRKISRAVRGYNDANGTKILVHLDACQAPLWLPCALDTLGVDLMSLDAGKCYGPKGVGVLVKRHWTPIHAIVFGGGQEHGLRPGTENTALIVGCVESIMIAQQSYEIRSRNVESVRDYCIQKIFTEVPHVRINGSIEHRVANNINFSISGIDAEYAVIFLDAKGIAVSTRSACGVGKSSGSHVIREITRDDDRALSTIRVTLGEESTIHDIDSLVLSIMEYMKLMEIA